MSANRRLPALALLTAAAAWACISPAPPAAALCRQAQHAAFREMGLLEIPTKAGLLFLDPAFAEHRDRIVAELQAIDFPALAPQPQPHPFLERIPEAVRRVNELFGLDADAQRVDAQVKLAQRVLNIGSIRFAGPDHLRFLIVRRQTLAGHLDAGRWLPGLDRNADGSTFAAFSLAYIVYGSSHDVELVGPMSADAPGLDLVLIETDDIHPTENPHDTREGFERYLASKSKPVDFIRPWIVVHELAEEATVRTMPTLHIFDRWFTDGLAEAVADIILRDMGYQAVAEAIGRQRASEFEQIPRNQISLRYWPSVNVNISHRVELGRRESARYACAGMLMSGLIERHGRELIPRLVRGIAQRTDPAPEGLVTIVSDAAGEDVSQLLDAYQDFESREQELARLREDFLLARRSADNRKAFEHLIRIIELSTPDQVSVAHVSRVTELLLELGCHAEGLQVIHWFYQIVGPPNNPSAAEMTRHIDRLLIRYAFAAGHPEWAGKAADNMRREYPNEAFILAIDAYRYKAEGRHDMARSLAAWILEETAKSAQELDPSLKTALESLAGNTPPPLLNVDQYFKTQYPQPAQDKQESDLQPQEPP